MINPYAGEFDIIQQGDVIHTKETRPYGGEYTILVYCFERSVIVRRTLACQQCEQEFSYEFDAILRWENGYRHETTERDAREQLFAQERQRTSTPDHDDPVLCPHCGATQGARDKLQQTLAQVLEWLKR